VIRSRHWGVKIAGGDHRLFSPTIHGKDENGDRAKSHQHAFYLPTDEDGDSRIDHITIYALAKFSRDEVSALDRLRSISFGKDVQSGNNHGKVSRQPSHRLLLVGLDRVAPSNLGIFGPACIWASATPYVAYRHLKTRGKKRDDPLLAANDSMRAFMERVIGEDWDQRDDLRYLPMPKAEFLPDPIAGLGWTHRSLQFRRARNRPHDDGYSRSFGTFRLIFPEAVTGPICLGYGCHFGMGIFRAVSAPD
jgi:CRISPR-associated protein Csb2